MSKIGVYAGSFDPVTKGHLWLMGKAVLMVDILYVLIAVNSEKKTLFTSEQRVELLKEALEEQGIKGDIRVKFVTEELVVKVADQLNATFLFRGIRDTIDFEVERKMQNVNLKIMPNIETIFLIPPMSMSEISSSMVKELMKFKDGEEIAATYLTSNVLSAMKKKFKKP